MIIAEFDTRHFSWKVFANNEEQAYELMKEAWKKHQAEYSDAVDWELLQDMGYFTDPVITEITCGAVVRDHSIIHRDENAPQIVHMAAISHRHGFDVHVGDEGLIKEYLRTWADENWSDIEGLEDTPDKPEEMTDEIAEQFFEISCDAQGDTLEYHEAYPVHQP